MATHKDDKKSDDITKNKRPNDYVISKADREQMEKRKEARRKAKKKAQQKRARASFVILILLLITFATIYVLSFIFGLKTNNLKEGVAPAENESLNILVVGMDIGDVDQEGNIGIRRTDTIMVLNYNPITDEVNIVSIPRDTLIEVEDAYDSDGNYIPYWKINAAYALGGEDELIMHVEDLLEVNINYIIEIDYEAFRSIIDAIGGVKMYIDREMDYDDDAQDLHIHFTKGKTILLDGQKAEEFIRWRKNNDGSGFIDGDLGRISNQQKFMKALFKKIINPITLFNVPDMMNAIKSNVVTNMNGSQIVNYALKIAKNSGINMHTLKGYDEEIYDQSFLVVEKRLNLDILKTIKSGVSMSSVDRTIYDILVLNGTNINGLAGGFRSDLQKLGYENITIDNATSTKKSIILYKDSELRDILKSDTGITKTSKDMSDYPKYDAVIILGEDYN
ncbi:MAG: LCP family protein [Clostridium sp.]|nr:LCP family protein [Clostridium sp.]